MSFKHFIQITKPGIIFGNVLSVAGGFFLASKGHFDLALFLAAVIGTSLVVASGCVFNNCIDLGMAGGASIVGNAFFMTAALFGGLSFFAIKSTKDFTSWSKPIMIAFFIILAVSLINVFFLKSPLLYVAIQAIFLLVISVMVLIDTQNVIRGAYETPMDGAVALYLDFFNLFITLLQLFGIFGGSDE